MDFQSIMNKLSDLAQTGVSKGRELAEIGKLKLANVSEEDTMRKVYIQIGKLCYEKGCTCDDPSYAGLCARIAASKEKIAYNNEKIADIKAASDIADADIDDLIQADVAPEDDCSCGCDEHKED